VKGEGRKKEGFRGAFAFLVFISLVFLGCRTAPPALPAVHPSEALPPDMDVYFYVSVADNADVLRRFAESGGPSAGSDYFLNHARFIYGAVRQAGGDGAGNSGGLGPAFLLAAEGDYSAGLVEFGIRRGDGWEELTLPVRGGEVRYYRNGETGTEISIPSSRLILMGTGGIAESLSALYGALARDGGADNEFPENAAGPLGGEIISAFESHSSAFYFPSPEKTGLSAFIPANIPVPLRSALLFTDPGEGGYDVSGSLAFQNDRDALTMSVMLRLMFSAFLGSRGMSLTEIRTRLKVVPARDVIDFSGLKFPPEMAEEILLALMGKI
jgi:hypothetical protein